jgi:hypothetical protein
MSMFQRAMYPAGSKSYEIRREYGIVPEPLRR